MRSMKRLKTSLVLLLILSFPATTLASPGKYVNLDKGETVPWKAWCFDQVAAANIVAEKEMATKKCELKIEKAKELQKAKFDLDIGTLRAEMAYEVSTHQTTINALRKENQKLEQIVIDNSNPNWAIIFSVGTALGSLTTAVIMGIFL